MTEVKAHLNSYRQSPRKVRIVADLVRGKQVEEAMNLLDFTTKRATSPLRKLIASAVANARNLSIGPDKLFVKKITVDGGQTMSRQMPRSRGMANRIKKRTSHVSVVLEEKK